MFCFKVLFFQNQVFQNQANQTNCHALFQCDYLLEVGADIFA